MAVVKMLVPLPVTLSLALLIMSLAMASTRGQFLYVLKRPGLLLRAVIAVDIIPPLAAVAVIPLFPALSLASKTAILLMAISPVPPLVPGKAMKSGARPEYIYGLQLAMGLGAIITVPLLGLLIAHHYATPMIFPVDIVARNVLIGLALPILIGLALNRWIAQQFAVRAAPAVNSVATIMLAVAAIPIAILFWPNMMDLIGDGTVWAIALVVIISVLGGHILGGEVRSDRPALAFAAGTRHPGIALALAGANHADPAAAAAILLFLIVGLIATIPYKLLLDR